MEEEILNKNREKKLYTKTPVSLELDKLKEGAGICICLNLETGSVFSKKTAQVENSIQPG